MPHPRKAITITITIQTPIHVTASPDQQGQGRCCDEAFGVVGRSDLL